MTIPEKEIDAQIKEEIAKLPAGTARNDLASAFGYVETHWIYAAVIVALFVGGFAGFFVGHSLATR